MSTVLIVEDDLNLGNLYKLEFEEDGYRVVLAHDREDAYEKFHAERPDVTVVDVRLPKGNGIELSESLAAEDCDMPIVINTAFEQFKWDFRSWVADAYIVKSSDISELKRAVANLLLDRRQKER